MGLIVLFIVAGAFLWLLWYLFVKSVVWVFEPITKYVDNKDNERKEFESAVLQKLDDAEKKKTRDNLIPLKSRCPKCFKQTMYYDPATDRSKCKECDQLDI